MVRAPIPAGETGAAFGARTISAAIHGLHPGTVYHYRILATSELGSTTGPERTFTTGSTSSFVLPDGRAWELVSPPEKHGSALALASAEGGVTEAAADGSGLTYLARLPFEASPGNPVLGNGREMTQLLAARAADGSWSTRNIEVSQHGTVGEDSGQGNEYRFFTPDLSSSIVEQVGFDATPLSPQATEKTPYLHDDLGGEFTPLLTPANVLAGAHFGLGVTPRSFVGATPDLSHVVLSSFVPLTAGAAPGESLYVWTAGHLQLVSSLPGHEEPASLDAQLGDSNGNVRGAISRDGSRVFWGANEHLYVRDLAKGLTVQLDRAQGAPEPEAGNARFQLATGDGSRVLFTDGERLTADSAANGREHRDLYECLLVEVASTIGCRLTDLSADPNAGESATVQGYVLGASEDGAYVYFVANGALTSGSSPGDCVEGPSTPPPDVSVACNLFVAHEGAVSLVARLSQDDKPDWQRGEKSLAGVASHVTPSGRFLEFMSDRSLTGYDNRDTNSGQPDEEVFLYDSSNAQTSCVSCNPTEARPGGILDGLRGGRRPHVDEPEVWGEHWIAANVPGWVPIESGEAQYQPRDLFEDGRLFFDSSDALVSGDANGREDVYEYEPPGVGGCTTSNSSFVAAARGCVALISAGDSDQESIFMDASETGDDVFILTAEKLSSEDVDENFDVYDAHVCSAASPCRAPQAGVPPCSAGESCRAAPTPQPPLTGAPASAGLSGPGNVAGSSVLATKTTLTRPQLLARALHACRKGPKRKRAACERRARKRYGAAARRAAHKRRRSSNTHAKGGRS
jgi:hypothetical protein